MIDSIATDSSKKPLCPDCGDELVPTYWLASTDEYPAKEVVKVSGVRCKSCGYTRFEYVSHTSQAKE